MVLERQQRFALWKFWWRRILPLAPRNRCKNPERIAITRRLVTRGASAVATARRRYLGENGTSRIYSPHRRRSSRATSADEKRPQPGGELRPRDIHHMCRYTRHDPKSVKIETRSGSGGLKSN